MAQLIITMRREFAKRFARDRALLDVESLLKPLQSARLIGRPGFSMRVTIEEAEVADLKRAIGQDFIIEPDFVMNVLQPTERAPARPAKRAAGRSGR